MAEGQGKGLVPLPVGVVTFVMADAEGSSRLWEEEPAAMSAALTRLDQALDLAVERHHGVRPVDQGEGDSFLVAFARASDAVAFAAELQAADISPLRLRLGLHTGEVQLRDEGNYVGSTLNRCARLRDLAHGRQTVLSGATHNIVADHLPAGTWVVDQGMHRLRGFARPEHVFQLCHRDLPTDFPPLRSVDAGTHNLPAELTRFIGRTQELAEVRSLLSGARLVTLTGSAGVGKTRLALQFASTAVSDYADGVWWTDLAPVVDADLVPAVVARALGLQDEPARSTAKMIAHHLADRRLLLVLDNCEHVVHACASFVESMLRSCPSLIVLATSREPLGIPGELAWRVPSLALARNVSDQCDAVELFLERAGRARPDFTRTTGAHAAVHHICQRLDGVALAIELAAAGVRFLSPEHIAAGLDDRFSLLTGGARTGLPRQQTLRASLDWSWDLLDDAERLLFRRLGVFAGSFDLAAAEAVAAGDGPDPTHVMPVLSRLVDKSLVVVEDSQDTTRFRLLETMRYYALERVGDINEEASIHRRHRDHYLRLAELAAELAQGAEQDAWLDVLQRELDNLRAAFAWSHRHGDIEEALRLASALGRLWIDRGQFSEGRIWFDSILPDAGDISPAVRAKGLIVGAQVEVPVFGPSSQPRAEEAIALARTLSDERLLVRALFARAYSLTALGERSWEPFRETIELARQIGDDRILADALGGLGLSLFFSGDPVAARPLVEEGLELANRIGHTHAAWANAIVLGTAMFAQGELAECCSLMEQVARETSEVGDRTHQAEGLAQAAAAMALMGRTEEATATALESIAVATDFGAILLEGFGQIALGLAALSRNEPDQAIAPFRHAAQTLSVLSSSAAWALCGLAQAELVLGDTAEARKHADEADARTAAAPTSWFHAMALFVQAQVEHATGDAAAAEDAAHKALATLSEAGDGLYTPDALELLAALASQRGSYEYAARLCGAATAARARVGYLRLPVYRESHERLIADLTRGLGAERLSNELAQGALITAEQAVAYAARGRGQRKRPSTGWESLTPTELLVAEQVAAGLANREIAARLFMSGRTVQAHLRHIYAKVGVSSRVQLAQETTKRR